MWMNLQKHISLVTWKKRSCDFNQKLKKNECKYIYSSLIKPTPSKQCRQTFMEDCSCAHVNNGEATCICSLSGSAKNTFIALAIVFVIVASLGFFIARWYFRKREQLLLNMMRQGNLKEYGEVEKKDSSLSNPSGLTPASRSNCNSKPGPGLAPAGHNLVGRSPRPSTAIMRKVTIVPAGGKDPSNWDNMYLNTGGLYTRKVSRAVPHAAPHAAPHAVPHAVPRVVPHSGDVMSPGASPGFRRTNKQPAVSPLGGKRNESGTPAAVDLGGNSNSNSLSVSGDHITPGPSPGFRRKKKSPLGVKKESLEGAAPDVKIPVCEVSVEQKPGTSETVI